MRYFKTFDGRKVSEDEITHEHLSNWYWYINVTMKEYSSQKEKDYIDDLIYRRFDGEVLEYRPLKHFRMEIMTLKHKNMIKKNGDIVLPNTIFYHKIGTMK